MRPGRLLALTLLAAFALAAPALAQEVQLAVASGTGTDAATAAQGLVAGCAEVAEPSSFADKLKMQLKDALASGNLTFALLLVLLAGFGVTLTPCVYPLIPITLSIFGARQSTSKLGGFALSSTYVGGMVLLYSSLGIGFALAGKVMGTFMQSPVVTIGVALFCLIMAASMFGAFEIALPSALQNKLSQAGGTGFKGAFVMGLVAGLIAAPCTGPVLTFILTLIARDGDVGRGALLMIVFSLGIGIPFLVLGTFSSAISAIPKTGAWTEGVKGVFGVLMVAAALYFLGVGTPAIGDTLGAIGPAGLWIAPLLLVIGAAIGGLHLSFKFTSTVEKTRKAIGLVLCVLGVTAFIGWTEAEPVSHGPDHAELAWKVVGSEDGALKTFDATLAAAKSANKPVMIDFYADWCAACKELDRHTYSDPKVQAEAERFELIKVDATDDTDDLKAIQNRFNVIGLPTVAFLNSTGSPCPSPRVTGFVAADKYLPLMQGVR
jgi:thiol:disulfide interchange protein DsbD